MVFVTQDARAPRGTVQEKPLLFALLVTLTLSAVFVTFPQIDIAISRIFYVEGEGFPASRMGELNTFRAFGQYFPLTLTIVLVFGLVLKLIYPSRPSLFPPRFTLYFASLFLLGPALLVNGLFKPFFDRPRPRNTLEFGGQDPFIHAWALGGDFFDDRSFVSGEAAVVVCLIPLAFFVPVVWRRCVFVLLSLFAALTALNRIAFGAHFLSDVLIAAGLMAMLSIGLAYLFYGRSGSQACDIKLEAAMTEFGHRLHAVRREGITAVRRRLSLAPMLLAPAPSTGENGKA
ncbi:phosphatase PAP2 family protein [Rhizobium sp. 'Codium 1']|uniref:phosphatase PAP2 family protein n=1 Tax=Rhizobium sp. 'Codium 1' TaxID=2940484 RepID=UPI001E409EDD|nr:phosphatase PAP2 family protein [Rhizobium sp. 'Codium 1']MCC8934492.1 phosphatase PAP2 family protein [Rhizobium sp. 'Codium 1']